jgi:hypothetical protein
VKVHREVLQFHVTPRFNKLITIGSRKIEALFKNSVSKYVASRYCQDIFYKNWK